MPLTFCARRSGLPRVLAGLLLAAAAGQAGAATLQAPGWSAEVRGARIVALTNRLTGEMLVAAARRPPSGAGLHRLAEREMDAAAAPSRRESATRRVVRQTAEWPRAGMPPARMTTVFAVEEATGDLVVTQEGRDRARGVYGISWGLGDVPDPVEVLVPGNSGQRFGPGAPNGSRVFEYPIGWEAPFVLIQGRRGGFIVRAEDARYRFKNLALERSRRAVRMRFESRNTAPFEQTTAIASSRWRVTPYRGTWQVGAALYRRWAQKRYALAPLERKAPAWARDIGFVAIMSLDRPTLRELARHCRPRQTLLYLPDWRRDGYDRNYPDYTAVPAFEPFVKEAHRLGFRVMPHVNYFGCDPKHPLYAALRKWQMRDPFTKELQWWDWVRADPPIKFAYINPASRTWRRLFVARMAQLCRRYRVDALHLDQTLCIFNDDNGLVDGMNCMEGNVALHRDLRHALPDVALSGEGLDEVTCRYEQFAQRHLWGLNHADGTWDDRLIAQAHPVSSAVLTPYTALYGYLGMANPNTSGLYTAWQQGYERFGVLPTYAWPDVDQLRRPSPAGAEALTLARFFQARRPTPDYERPWRPGDLFVYRLADGRRAFYRREEGVLFGVETGRGATTVLSRRLEGVRSAAVDGSVPGWPAYDARKVFGLDPRRTYRWSPSARDLRAPRISALPAWACLTRSGIGAGFARFRIDSAVDADAAGTMRLPDMLDSAAGGVRLADGTLRRADGGAFEDSSGGSVRPEGDGLFMHPPWRAVGKAPAGRSPARPVTFVEFPLRLPDRDRIVFDGGARLNAGAPGRSDGVTFRVVAECAGRTLTAEAHNATAVPVTLSLDLSAFRGQPIRLRLEVDPGPAGDPAFDWGHIEQPAVRVLDPAPARMAVLQVEGMRLSGPALAAAGEAETVALPRGAAQVRLPLPNTIVLPFTAPASAALPCDLLRLTPVSHVLFGDGLERPSYGFFRAQAGEATCGAVTRAALHLHPPPNGRTLADYWLRLPPRPAHVVGYVGVRDGSKSEGLALAVEVNGRQVWSRAIKPGSGWVPLDVDLRPWQGQPVMLTLISDSLGDYSFDWAVWGEPALKAAE